MGKVCAIVILFAMVMAMPEVYGVDESPKAVEKWFEKLSHAKEKVTKFHFYYHDILSGKNPTSIIVTEARPLQFGQINIFDDRLTVGPNITSKQVGQAQGSYVGASLEETSLLVTMNLVFTDGKYNGSTLALFGRDPILAQYREMSIVGGSGRFRLARGIATARTYSFNPTSGDAVVEYHVIVVHYK